MRVTTDRLVLLVAPAADNNFNFEVRSLQEYMAARALVAGSDEEVRKALEIILPADHWRNTYLLALGRLVTERPKLGIEILRSLSTVDEVDTEGGVLLVGAQAAAQLYLDGVAAEYPTARKALLTCAMRLFGDTADFQSGELEALVGLLYQPELDPAERKIVQDALRKHATKGRSSLAAKFLANATGLHDPLAKIARSLAANDFKYERPLQRSREDRLFMLYERVIQISGNDPGEESRPMAGLTPLVPEIDKGHASADDDRGVGRWLLVNSQSPALRGALVQIAGLGSLREPDLAFQAAQLLRMTVSGREVGDDLQKTMGGDAES